MNDEKSRSVNMSVDKFLRLVSFPLFEESSSEADFWRIRFLQVGVATPEAMVAFQQWQKINPKEAAKIASKLRKMAETETELKLKTVKRVGSKKKIFEIVGDSARFFCFYDGSRELMTIVAVETFWIGKGNKKKNQNKAIGRAENLLERWENATPVPGNPDLRIEK